MVRSPASAASTTHISFRAAILLAHRDTDDDISSPHAESKSRTIRALTRRRWGRGAAGVGGRGCCRPGLLVSAFFSHLIEEGPSSSRPDRASCPDLVNVLALQIENVLERLLPACSSTATSSGDKPFISVSATCVTDD